MGSQILENRITLIEALESGKYEQGFGALKGYTCFCVLGVACDIYNSDNWDSVGYSHYFKSLTGRRHLDCPPDEVINYFGMKNGLPAKLVELNDSQCYNFREIAKYLRNEWKIDV